MCTLMTQTFTNRETCYNYLTNNESNDKTVCIACYVQDGAGENLSVMPEQDEGKRLVTEEEAMPLDYG